MRIASVDIGTNTVRCLLSDVEGGVLTPLSISRSIVRLGEGLRHRGRLDPEAVARLCAVLRGYRDKLLESKNPPMVRAVGTSALRDAGSQAGVTETIEEALGFPVDVISGQEEARLTTLGVQAGVGSLKDDLVVDIGGGSTELVLVRNGEMIWWSSLQQGAVHLMEEILRDDPPTKGQVEAFRAGFKSVLRAEREDGGRRMAGTAGTPTTLAAMDLGIDEYDPTLVNGHVLPRETIQKQMEGLLASTSAQRLAIPGMEKGREDVIVAGTLMVLEIMERWGHREMIVSDWGLLEGIAIDAAKDSGLEGRIGKEE